MSGAFNRRFSRQARHSNLLRGGKIGAKQGTRVFDSTGHRISRVFASQFEGIVEIAKRRDADGRIRSEPTPFKSPLEFVLFPDMFTQELSRDQLAEFRETKLGKLVLGVPFKSKQEANCARYFEALRTKRIETGFEVVNWLYEPCRFWYPIARGVTNFVPDFMLILRGRPIEFVEVKGYLDAKSKTAMTRFRRYFPEFELKLIDGKAYRAIERELAAVIPEWEK